MKKYTQRELCYEAFGDVMRGLGNVAKAGAKLAVPAGAELAKRATSPVTMFNKQQPANAVKEFLKSSRTVGVYKKDIKHTDIILGRVPLPASRRDIDANKRDYRLTNPSNFKELKKVDNILLIDFDAKDFETGRIGKFTAYLIPATKGEAGYTVFAIQEYSAAATTSAGTGSIADGKPLRGFAGTTTGTGTTTGSSTGTP